MSTEMRNWMDKKRKRIAFGLAVLLLALQLSPLSLTDGMGQVATAESVGNAGEETAGTDNPADSQTTAAPETSQDPTNTMDPEETKDPAETERPAVLEPNQVEWIVATGGAVFVEDTSVMVSDLQATNRTTTSITLSWKKAPEMDITGYYLYQYDFELRDYVWVDTVENTEYTIQDLKPGQQFYYTVSAYSEKDKLQSHFCAPLHTYTVPEKLETVTMKSYAKTSITLSWKEVESATGYLIYRATETGGFTQVGTTL